MTGPGDLFSDGAQRVARRDASWFNYPGRSGRFHFFASETRTACGLLQTPCDEHDAATNVEHALRCRRHGCAERWPS